jgi:hypothetical protein
MSPTPEQRARLDIDTALAAAGWVVQDRAQMNLAAGRGCARVQDGVRAQNSSPRIR